jgi:hypothetical protein
VIQSAKYFRQVSAAVHHHAPLLSQINLGTWLGTFFGRQEECKQNQLHRTKEFALSWAPAAKIAFDMAAFLRKKSHQKTAIARRHFAAMAMLRAPETCEAGWHCR